MPELMPVDPHNCSLDELKHRARIVMSPWYVPPDRPLPSGWYRCFLCLREFRKNRSDEEVLTDMNRRFGDVPEERRLIICNDCNVIISNDIGIPL